MTIARKRMALCAAVAAASGWTIGAPAAAQEEVIAACQALPTEAQRFSCLADALRLANGADVSPSDLTLPEASQAAPEPAAPTAAEAQRSAPREAAFGELGAERFEERPRRDETALSASVVSSDLVGFNMLQVELDNGQVWRQVQAEKPWDMILDGEPSAVVIRRSRFGGYRMTVADADRTMSVERIR